MKPAMKDVLSVLKKSKLALTGAALFALAATMPAVVVAKNFNPGVLPPQSKPYGMTYGEWNAKWWQWAEKLPIDAHPLTDTADCSTGQTGKVWFLGGTFSSDPGAKIERTCTIPSGTPIFVPILNIECSTLEGDGETPKELRGCTNFFMETITEVIATIDGVPIEITLGKDLPTKQQDYRAPSPPFIFGPLPDPNLYGADEGTTTLSVADGYYLMLAPLSIGEHKIEFTGTFGPPINFTLPTINYTLTVVPQGQYNPPE